MTYQDITSTIGYTTQTKKIDERKLAGSTVWRWLGFFGSLKNTLRNDLEIIRQAAPNSTLYRHLKLAGATKLKLGVSQQKVRIRWTRDHTHDLWLGDFQEGPYVLVDGEALPTNLCLFIDCHSRYVAEGRYYLKQTIDIVIDSLIRVWTIHGSPKELYLDNAKRSNLTPILVVDEAHLLNSDVLTDLRLLISSTPDPSTQLKIVLSGHFQSSS